jgi:hypothetical protein
MPRRSALLACAVALAVGTTLTSPPAQALDAARATLVPTHFAVSGSGFGTRVGGGALPTGSSPTAYQHIGCTNKAGLVRTNDVAEQEIPGLGTLSGLSTRIWTTRHHGVVASHARHRIARLALVDTPLGSLALTGITSEVKAFHDSTGFNTATSSTLGGISLTPVIGPVQTFDLPTPDQPLTIPGVATIAIGPSATHSGAHGAVASAYALRIDVPLTDTHVKLARSHATIADGVSFGLFHGRSFATQVSALDDTLTSGPNPLTIMPCQGTGGRAHGKTLADVDLAGLLAAHGLTSRHNAEQTRARAHGYEMGKVGRVNLGSGALVVDAIVGRATVTRTAHRIIRTAKGTSVGKVTVNGEVRRFSRTGVLEIPGVAKLEERVVHRTRTGLSVTALRITLLDGTGAVIDLGHAQLSISKNRNG